MRRDPSEQSEMVSQILYGEKVEILKQSGNWLLIKNCFDQYEGWVDYRGILEDTADNVEKVVLSNAQMIVVEGQNLLVPAGAEVEGVKIKKQQPTGKQIIETAQMFLGIPYLWGGRSSFGFDCSGLVQIVYKINGMALPRDAKDQAQIGQIVSSLSESFSGDLAFFSTNNQTITHVGIIIDQQTLIHASGYVRIDTLDQLGIYNKQRQEYTHKLVLIKRIIV